MQSGGLESDQGLTSVSQESSKIRQENPVEVPLGQSC